jgi:hypothetical protein
MAYINFTLNQSQHVIFYSSIQYGEKMNKKTTYSNMRGLIAVLAVFLFVAIAISPVMADPLPSVNHIFLNVANDDGVKYNEDGATFGGPDNTYYILANGGGMNQLHISTSNGPNNYGEVTTSNAQSGTIYVTTTGGRGFNDDNILLISVQDPIPDDFSVHIKSRGYTWIANPAGPSGADANLQYVSNALDETFTKEDFIYGPQTWKPGPASQGILPLYYGQDRNDLSTNSYLMFVDLNAGNTRITPGAIDNGHVKVEFSFSNLGTSAALNAYSWVSQAANSNEGGAISWTNRVSGSGSSGYRVIGTVPQTNNLIAHVVNLDLKPSVEMGLTEKFYDVMDELYEGNEKAEVNILNAFIQQVNAQTNRAITPEDASDLIAEARTIISSIQA